jgi:hypothetical protein
MSILHLLGFAAGITSESILKAFSILAAVTFKCVAPERGKGCKNRRGIFNIEAP